MKDDVARQPGVWPGQLSDADGSALEGIRVAWRDARTCADPRTPELARAVRQFAHEGRLRGAAVTSLVCLLDRLVHRGQPMPTEDGFERVRAWAGTELIRAYYGGD